MTFQNYQYSYSCLWLATLHNTRVCISVKIPPPLSHPLSALSSPESLKVMEQGSMVNSVCGKTVLSRGNAFRAHVMAMWAVHIHLFTFQQANKCAKYILQPLTGACITHCKQVALINLINQVK